MVFDDYCWAASYTPGDDRVSGEISNMLFDRKDGAQMLYFLNACALLWHWNSRLSMRNLERATRQLVPRSRHTQQEVRNWIEQYLPVL